MSCPSSVNSFHIHSDDKEAWIVIENFVGTSTYSWTGLNKNLIEASVDGLGYRVIKLYINDELVTGSSGGSYEQCKISYFYSEKN